MNDKRRSYGALVFLLLYSEISRERNRKFSFDTQLYSDCWEKKIILAPAPLLLSIRFTGVSTRGFHRAGDCWYRNQSAKRWGKNIRKFGKRRDFLEEKTPNCKSRHGGDGRVGWGRYVNERYSQLLWGGWLSETLPLHKGLPPTTQKMEIQTQISWVGRPTRGWCASVALKFLALLEGRPLPKWFNINILFIVKVEMQRI